MDKSQKELIKTYYRKRSSAGIFEDYEIEYGVENDYFDEFEFLRSAFEVRNLDNVDDLELRRYKNIINDRQMEVRNNREYNYLQRLIDLVDKLLENRNG